ncbi:hypothetical protein [Parageobacillus thermoglucosidasius]|uniref:Uncharacterized protein n=1 Tax=Parageobacillus thermoglucosidasius TaxID=1426 RepID=A0AAN1D7Y7_PARTM|nr:hypothetical protein [Parageobacillus thermoglucosidasius]ALF11423.1 hypothetical protein AOT13_16170 [Parageobacillus thermoglucosidasius]ANZ31501.1 hypothetical protein BCV53_16205 [Parageobacillus thermoglucosidasius]APM82238.1 hypothetical protein BCV54_16215 [Parageobacillus thermoglucosidasius]KJX69033.1 hypothetical protein WH82_08935 [Parageobacillus thermoglucosidasius]MBY6267364.1 hypothetical protein [Parageobacillus thermoglucosidasius]
MEACSAVKTASMCQSSALFFPPRTFARRLRQSGRLRHPSREDSGFSNAARRQMDDGPIVCVGPPLFRSHYDARQTDGRCRSFYC